MWLITPASAVNVKLPTGWNPLPPRLAHRSCAPISDPVRQPVDEQVHLIHHEWGRTVLSTLLGLAFRSGTSTAAQHPRQPHKIALATRRALHGENRRASSGILARIEHRAYDAGRTRTSAHQLDRKADQIIGIGMGLHIAHQLGTGEDHLGAIGRGEWLHCPEGIFSIIRGE